MTEATPSLDDLVADAASGNEAAWWLLWESVEPRLERLLRNPKVTGRLSEDEDDVRNIMVAVIEKLRDDDCRRLRSYIDKREDKRDEKSGGFEAWLSVVAKRAAIDYMRSHQDFVDRRRDLEASSTGKWVIPGELPNHSQIFGARPPVTDRGSALALLRYAYECLPEEQMKALELWILNNPYEVISQKLEFESAEAAHKAVRAALERLRRRFREGKKK